MTDHMTDHADLRRILAGTKSIAMVGLSLNPVRPSAYVAAYLAGHGFEIWAVNPAHAGKRAFGRKIYPDIKSLAAEVEAIDMVDIFRRSEAVGAIVDAALEHLRPRGLGTVWMQIGIRDDTAAARARAAGVDVVMDRCTKIEHQRLTGTLRMAGFATGIISSRRPG
ncbi:MAG: CoA-binding protein [Pseudomonadota bacterium]